MNRWETIRDLIPPFQWNTVVVQTWTESGDLFFWVVLMGFLVTLACGLVGNFLILRRMALVGDAISHSVLPGLGIAFLAAYALSSTTPETANPHDFRNPSLMFTGALLAGILTTFIIELIHKKSRIKQDSAIGITFSSLFALGVILISLYADRIDLDQECVLYGEISFVPLEPPLELGSLSLGPPSVIRMGVVALLTILLVVIFYKQLLVSSFDPGLAASLGINATLVHYGLMGWLSVVVVSAFEAVGAILVIAMLILPGATASLLTTRLPVILALTGVQALISSLVGLHLSLWLECSTAAAMVVVASSLFVLAWIFSPQQGLIRSWIQSRIIHQEPPPV